MVEIRVITFWILSNAAFAITMFATLLTDSVWGANIIIGATGFSWAISLWAPFALLGEAIHSSSPRSVYALAPSAVEDELEVPPIPMADRRTRLSPEADTNETTGVQDTLVANRAHVSRTNLTDEEGADDIGSPAQNNPFPSYSHGEGEDDSVGTEPEHGGIGDKAGIILGIHNVFVVIPQFLVTGLSSIIFAIFEPSRKVLKRSIVDAAYSGTEHAHTPWSLNMLALLRRAEETRPFDSIGLMFRIGGVSAAIACWLCVRLSKQLR